VARGERGAVSELKEIRTHPALDCIPLMKEDEFARLVWSIRKIGLIRPILEDAEGRILDGRCRFLACDIAGVEPTLARPKDVVAVYIYAANAARRHLTIGQRAMIIALVEDVVPDDDGFTEIILSENLLRAHHGPDPLCIADALVDKPDFPQALGHPEAQLVARHSNWRGGSPIARLR
jgi:ParB-like chromosome segregation protein Spo0J